jgi:hypothetical protein
MLGHLKPSLCQLSAQHKQLYWQFYCGGCANLRKQNGLGYSLLLSNELTLVLGAFAEYYQNLTLSTTACPATALLLRQKNFKHAAIDKASQLTIVLAWLKALDWQTDQPSFAKKILLKHLARQAQKVIPALLPESQNLLGEYAQLTQSNESDLAIIRQQSNRLSQMLVMEIAQSIDCEELTKQRIAHLFGQVGELIVLADHLIDLEKDMYGKQYNPILVYANDNQVSLAEAYQWLVSDYRRLVYQIQALSTEESAFCQAILRASLQQLNVKVEKSFPLFLGDPQAESWQGKMTVVQAGFPHIPPEMVQATTDPCCDSCINAMATACAAACCECSCRACSNALCTSREEREERRRNRRTRTRTN